MSEEKVGRFRKMPLSCRGSPLEPIVEAMNLNKLGKKKERTRAE